MIEWLPQCWGLGTPKPGENVGRHYCDSSSGGNSGKALLRAGFSVREGVPADHNCNQAGGLGNRPGKERLDRTDTAIEWRGMSGEWEDQYAQE